MKDPPDPNTHHRGIRRVEEVYMECWVWGDGVSYGGGGLPLRDTEMDCCCIDKPRGASPLGQFLLVGPLFLCVEKVRGRK